MNLLLDTYYHSKINAIITIDTSQTFTQYAREVLETNRPVVVMDESISGNYQISLTNGTKSVSHNGIRLSVIGEFRSYNNEVYGQFFNRYIEIQPPGVLTSTLEGTFDFENPNFPTTTYYGNTIQAIYAVQIQMKKLSSYVVIRESQFYTVGFDVKAPVKVSRNVIGISNLLRFEVYLPNEQVECDSALVGQIYFVYVKIKVVSLSLKIINQEFYEDEKIRMGNETVLGDFQLLDGSPARGTQVPFRVFLKNLNVRRFLNFPGSQLLSRPIAKVVLTDSDGQVYSKQLNVFFVITEPEIDNDKDKENNKKPEEQSTLSEKTEVNNNEPFSEMSHKDDDDKKETPNDANNTSANDANNANVNDANNENVNNTSNETENAPLIPE